jgi:hypothetical protein
MSRIRTSLQNVPSAPKTDDEMMAMRRKAWQFQGCIVCFPDEINDEWLRQGITNWANTNYGKRI